MTGGPKVVVVTGANGGIGFETTKCLLAAGHLVAGLDLAIDALTGLGPDERLLPVRCDVRGDADVATAVDAVIDRWGRIDVLINDAAVAPYRRLVDMPLEAFQNVFDVNVYGYVRMIKAVLPTMQRQHQGTIINVASMLSSVGLPDLPAYAASKGAVEGLTRCLALDVCRDGIAVILFHPPSTRTPAAQPLRLPRIFTGDPVKVGRALARCVSSRRRLIAADYRTAGLIALTRVTPGLFGRFLTRLVGYAQRRHSAHVDSTERHAAVRG